MKLKELRERNKLSQVELAKILKVSSAAISNWEKERRQPDLEMVITIADYFGVTVDEVIGRTVKERPRKYTESEHTLDPDQVKELYEKIKQVDKEYIPAINTLVDGLIDKKI